MLAANRAPEMLPKHLEKADSRHGRRVADGRGEL